MNNIALCIPAYQAETHLPRLLRSALDQIIPFDEIWVYDDASSDATSEIAKSFGAQVVRGSTNVGCSAGKNKLLYQVSSTWIHFHDADDILLPNFTKLAHNWIARTDCPDVVLFDYEYRDFNSGILISKSDFQVSGLTADPARYAILNQINPFCGLYRVEKLKSVGGYDIDPDILYNEDVAFHCKLAIAGLSFSAEKEISIINYRMNSSMSQSNQLLCMHAHVEVMRRLARDVGVSYPLEIKTRLWAAAQVLASFQQWHDAYSALDIGQSLTKSVPNGNSRIFTLLFKLIGDKRAFWLRELLIRIFKPSLRP